MNVKKKNILTSFSICPFIILNILWQFFCKTEVSQLQSIITKGCFRWKLTYQVYEYFNFNVHYYGIWINFRGHRIMFMHGYIWNVNITEIYFISIIRRYWRNFQQPRDICIIRTAYPLQIFKFFFLNFMDKVCKFTFQFE